MTDRERVEKLIAAAKRYDWPDDEVIEKEILPIFEEIRQEERAKCALLTDLLPQRRAKADVHPATRAWKAMDRPNALTRLMMSESDNAGDKTEFEIFYRRECQSLYRYVYVWVGNSECATEIVQESFSNLYQMQSGKESPAYERARLFRVARNKTADWLRRRHTRGAATGSAAASAAFEKLASRDQECLALRLSGLNYQAVAEIMNIDRNLVGQATNQALRKFEETYD